MADTLWAASGGGSSIDEGRQVVIDNNQNVFVLGLFTGSATVGNVQWTTSNPAVYLAKYAVGGEFQWAKQVMVDGLPAGTRLYSDGLAADPSGNLLVSMLGIRQIRPGVFDRSSFLMKCELNGRPLWSHTEPSATGLAGGGAENCLAVDSQGNAFVAQVIQASTMEDDWIFLFRKVNPEGTELWRTTGQAGSLSVPAAVGVDSKGHFVVAGRFYGQAVFGQTLLSATAGSDIFLAKINSDGSYSWAVSAGGENSEMTSGIALDSSDNIYLTGAPSPLLQKYDREGQFLWMQSVPGPGCYGDGVAVDSTGQVNVLGHYQGHLDLAGRSLDALPTAGTWATFLAQFSRSGDLVNLLNIATCSDFMAGRGMALDGDANVVVTGVFSGSASLGRFQLASSGNGKADTDTDMFLARFRPTAQGPSLQISRASDQIVLNWPAAAAIGFIPERASPTSRISNWQRAPGTPTLVGDQLLLTLPVAEEPWLFRLRK